MNSIQNHTVCNTNCNTKSNTALEVKDLYAGYGHDDVIHNINFTVTTGENLCIVGPNGCGKSTLLKSIAHIINYRGHISLNNIDIQKITRRELAQKIALLGQSAQVFFPYTVYETVAMGRYARVQGFLKNISAGDKAIINTIIAKLDIIDIKDKLIDELSGGQLQLVFLARTLAQNPEIILLDEPGNHLDLKHQIELLRYLQSWVREQNRILISVFHDLNMARYFSDTAIVMNNGKIAASGPSEKVLNSEILHEVYGFDIHGFMRTSLERW